MLEFLRQYRRLVRIGSGPWFAARAYASQSPLGAWEAWLAFFPVNGGPIVTSGPATFADTLEVVDQWTQSLSVRDLQGALEQALSRHTPAEPADEITPLDASKSAAQG